MGGDLEKELDERIRLRVEAILKERDANRVPRLVLLATQGTLDWAYPPFILASTAVAMGWEASVFFTFYGLELLKKDLAQLRISPLGNPAMPMKMPFGPEWFRGLAWNLPNALQTNLPGFERMATSLMERTLAQKGVASLEDLRAAALEGGARFTACQMTLDLFGYRVDQLIPGIEVAGAATFLDEARKAQVCLTL